MTSKTGAGEDKKAGPPWTSPDIPRRPAIQAIVVNYNAGQALLDCVASLWSEGVDRLLVVDNGSTDGSIAQLASEDRDVQIVSSGRNVGFGGGVNYGAGRSAGELLLVCNPDIVLRPGALGALTRRIEADPSLGLVGPALVAPDGSERTSGRAFPTLRRSGLHALVGLAAPGSARSTRYRAASRAGAATGIVDWVTGACLLVRREAFDAVGGFDERYFMYVEEVDLCWRLARAGWRTGYEAGAVVVHLAGVSTAAHPYRMVTAHHVSLWRFAWRTAKGADRMLLPFAAPAIVVRWALAALKELVCRSARAPARARGGSRLPRHRA
ncbi:MAG: glycosyltransferase family 2 protein [Acidimicrobiales bacterium]